MKIIRVFATIVVFVALVMGADSWFDGLSVRQLCFIVFPFWVIQTILDNREFILEFLFDFFEIKEDNEIIGREEK